MPELDDEVGDYPTVDSELRQIGTSALARLVDPSMVSRRVEVVHFVGAQRVRRKVSLDTLISNADVGWRGTNSLAVPLGYGAKPTHAMRSTRLRDVDVWDEAGTRLSILQASEDAVVSYAALVAGAEIIGRADDDTSGPVRLEPRDLVLLWRIAALPGDQAYSLARSLLASLDSERRIFSDRLRDALVAPEYRLLVERLAGSFVLCALVPKPEDAPRRALIKYSTDMSMRWSVRPSRSEVLNVRPILGRLGWRSYPVEFRAEPTLPARSWHLEVQTPERVQATDLVLQSGLHTRNALGDVDFAIDQEERDQLVGSFPSIAHTFLHDVQGFGHLRGAVGLRAEATSSIRFALAMGLLLSLTLLGGIVRSEWLMGAAASQSFTGLLLVAPSLLAGAFILREEHHLANRLLLPVRAAVVSFVMISIAAAALLAAESGRWENAPETSGIAAVACPWNRDRVDEQRTDPQGNVPSRSHTQLSDGDQTRCDAEDAVRHWWGLALAATVLASLTLLPFVMRSGRGSRESS